MGFKDLKRGDKILCIKDLVMNTGDIRAYQGEIYEITRNYDEFNNSIRFENSEGNKNHSMGETFFYEYFMIIDNSGLTDKILSLLDI